MSELDKKERTAWVKQRALELGFGQVGIAQPLHLKDEADRLRDWLDKGYQGKMSYLENHFDMRTDPRKLVENAQSVICFTYNYYPQEELSQDGPKIARYAYGRDYHKVVKKKMKILFREMDEKFGGISGRYFVDSAPVMEREWAKRAGLGWIGKNTLIINPKKGSYFFLAEMIIDLELLYDVSISDYCGTCTKCIEACPTDAIAEDGYIMDASKCISYATIELKDADLPDAFDGKMENWAFGCDICQEVCPWNRFSKPHNEPDFLPTANLQAMKKEDWPHLTEAQFDEVFHATPVKRTGYEVFMRNIKAL